MSEPQMDRSVGSTPAGRLGSVSLRPSARLTDVPVNELAGELTLRIMRGKGFSPDDASVALGNLLLTALRESLDVHANRFSRKRYSDMFAVFHRGLPRKPTIEGSICVEIGCGSVNPLAFMFLLLLLGAKKCIGIDLDRVQDQPMAVKALADLAAVVLANPAGIVGDYPVLGEDVLRRLRGFDLGKLRLGDVSGVDFDRLQLRYESLFEMSLGEGEADFVISNAFLEHVPQLERGIAELARIAKAGAIQSHNVDVSDHRHYESRSGPLDFLREVSGEEIVHYSNRLRLHQIAELFERNGFEVLGIRVISRMEVSDELRSSFAEPFRSMTKAQLEPLCGCLDVCRR